VGGGKPVAILDERLQLKPKPLEYVSPSLVSILSNCFLQAVFHTVPLFRNVVFRGPKARLGSACHAFLERIMKHELTDIPEADQQSELERLWSEEVSKEEELVRSSPLERHFGSAKRWPGYAVQRAQVMRKAQELLGSYRRAGEKRGRTESERFYNAYSGRLRGRADAVFSWGQRTEIRDYKTGNIYEEDAFGQMALKSRYRQQILLYAAMHHDQTGVWPVFGHVVPLTGDTVSIAIDPDEARREVETALGLLEEFNARVEQQDSPESLASPSQDVCRFCSYRALCEPFWQCVTRDWDWSRSVAIEGFVLQVHGDSAGDWTISTKVERGNTEDGVYRIRGYREVALDKGQRVRAINLMRTKEESFLLLVTEYTEIWPRSLRELLL
jgi:hypothetical protein